MGERVACFDVGGLVGSGGGRRCSSVLVQSCCYFYKLLLLPSVLLPVAPFSAFPSRPARAAAAGSTAAGVWCPPATSNMTDIHSNMNAVRKRAFAVQCLYTNDHFTQTGLEQT